MSDSPVAILYSSTGTALAVSSSQGVTGSQPGLVVVGSGSSGGWRYFKLTDDGTLFVTGSFSFNSASVLSVSVSNQPTTQSVQVASWLPGVTASVEQIGVSTTVVTGWAGSTTASIPLTSNSNRVNAIFFMEGNSTAYIKLGLGVSSASYTLQMNDKSYYDFPCRYTGNVSVIFSAPTGTLFITEIVE